MVWGGADFHAIDGDFKGGAAHTVARLEAVAEDDLVTFEAQDIYGAEAQPGFSVDDHESLIEGEGRAWGEVDMWDGAALDLGLDEQADGEGRPAPVLAAGIGIIDASDGGEHAGAVIDFTFGADDAALPLMGLSAEAGVEADAGSGILDTFAPVLNR